MRQAAYERLLSCSPQSNEFDAARSELVGEWLRLCVKIQLQMREKRNEFSCVLVKSCWICLIM